eukprot:5384995-Amphidinium_carterae.1
MAGSGQVQHGSTQALSSRTHQLHIRTASSSCGQWPWQKGKGLKHASTGTLPLARDMHGAPSSARSSASNISSRCARLFGKSEELKDLRGSQHVKHLFAMTLMSDRCNFDPRCPVQEVCLKIDSL